MGCLQLSPTCSTRSAPSTGGSTRRRYGLLPTSVGGTAVLSSPAASKTDDTILVRLDEPLPPVVLWASNPVLPGETVLLTTATPFAAGEPDNATLCPLSRAGGTGSQGLLSSGGCSTTAGAQLTLASADTTAVPVPANFTLGAYSVELCWTAGGCARARD
eukprot:SAG22_NODE_138_length_18031_cov_5.796621_7_plen_160_part_00